MFNQYPYLNINDLNLDYLLKAIKEMRYEVTNFVSLNAIKYADPIQWDITRQYEKNTIVIDPLTGIAYISVQPVPRGVALTREEYWTVVFDLGRFVARAAQNFTEHYEPETTLISSYTLEIGDWVVWGDVLYKVIEHISLGEYYVVGTNIEHFTMYDLYMAYLSEIANIHTIIGNLDDLTTDDKSSIVAAINSELSARVAGDNGLHAIIGNLADLKTADKSTVIAAINENYTNIENYRGDFITPEMFGAVGDGVTDDTTAVQDALDDGRPVLFVHDYAVTSVTLRFGNQYCHYLNAARHRLIALSPDEHVFVMNGNHVVIKDLNIYGLNNTAQVSAFYWNLSDNPSGFNVIDGLYFQRCHLCIEYGKGYQMAQSENVIYNLTTSLCDQILDMDVDGGMLWFNGCTFDCTSYEPWQTQNNVMFTLDHGILFIDNSTIESVNDLKIGFTSTTNSEVYVNNSVLEIPCINFAGSGKFHLHNLRVFQGQNYEFINAGVGGYYYVDGLYDDTSISRQLIYNEHEDCNIYLNNLHLKARYIGNVRTEHLSVRNINDSYGDYTDARQFGLATQPLFFDRPVNCANKVIYGIVKFSIPQGGGGSLYVSDGNNHQLISNLEGDDQLCTFEYESATGTVQLIRNGGTTISDGIMFVNLDTFNMMRTDVPYSITVNPAETNAIALSVNAPAGYTCIGAVIKTASTASVQLSTINAEDTGVILVANNNSANAETVTGNISMLYESI